VNPDPEAFAARPPARWLVATLVCLLFGVGFLTLRWMNGRRHADVPSLVSGDSGFSVQYLADPTGRMTFDDVLSRAAAGSFSPNAPGPGFVSCVWYRLSISNDSERVLRSVLAPSNEFLLDVRLYREGANGLREMQQAGNSLRWSVRTFPVLRPAFALSLPPHVESVVYVRVLDPVKHPKSFLLWKDEHSFLDLNGLYGLQLAGYFSLWFAMMAYNGFLYAVLRRRDYLLYFLYVLSMGMLVFSAGDLSTAVIPWPHWPLRGIVITALLNTTLFLLAWFSRVFLETRERAPSVDRCMRCMGWIVLALTLAAPAWFNERTASWYVATDLLANAIVIGALPILGLILLARRVPQAGLYVLAFVPLAVGMIYTLRENAGMPDARTNGIPVLCADALQLVFLALALAARYRRISDEANRLNQEYTSRLESEVAARTRELQRTNDSIARANRDKDRVLGIIGHDLRGPAHQLYALSQVLSSAGPGPHPPGETQQLAAEIEETCKAQIDLLDNLLLWSRMQSDPRPPAAEVRPVDEIVRSAVAAMERTARSKRISIAVELEPGLRLKADPQVVLTVLRNLLGNAIKFTNVSGRIAVTARGRGNSVELLVSDNGVGMSPAQLRELFSGPVPSSEGTSSEKGAGIGLALCHDLARANGGELRIESRQGAGTTATFTLPGAGEAPQTPQSRQLC
jgi:signal transduction histidine kinase